MRRKKQNKVLLLVVLLLSIGLGYALLTQDLTINGIGKVRGNTWDIHFANVQVNSNSVTLSEGDSAATIDSEDNTLVNYTVTLNVPGDFYEFTVDAVNAGTVDGMIGSITSKLNNVEISTTNPLPIYLDYSISYEDDTPIANNHLLEAGHTETYKIRLEFKRDIESSELPTTLQTNSFSFGLDYVQKTDNASPVPHTLTIYTINIYDGNNQEDTVISTGQAIPAAITQYSSQTEVIAALNTLAGGTVANPIYLKHKVSDDIVTESSVEFVINERYNDLYPGIAAGTYTIGNKNENSFQENNIAILEAAFGNNYCTSGTSLYDCDTTYLYVSTAIDGNIAAQETNFECMVNSDKTSYCTGVPMDLVLNAYTGSGVIYAANRSRSGAEVMLRKAIPYNIAVYETGAQARAALTTMFSQYMNCSIKHVVTNGIITESSVEFVITDEMANNNPTMTAGTYLLRGGEGINCVYGNNSWTCEQDSPYYNSNKAILETAFGSSSCSETTDQYGTNYECLAGGLVGHVGSVGDVYIQNGFYYCDVFTSGISGCDYFD